jgi:hypothetical protein
MKTEEWYFAFGSGGRDGPSRVLQLLYAKVPLSPRALPTVVKVFDTSTIPDCMLAQPRDSS